MIIDDKLIIRHDSVSRQLLSKDKRKRVDHVEAPSVLNQVRPNMNQKKALHHRNNSKINTANEHSFDQYV